MPTRRIDPSRVGEIAIASAGIDESAAAAASCFDAWCESMRPGHDIRPAEGTCGERRVSSVGWLVDDLFFNELCLSPIAYERRPRKAGEYILIRMYREGRSKGLLAGTAFRARPGEIHLFDQGAECRGVTSCWHRMRSVFVPYAAIGYEPRRHPGHLRLGDDAAVGRMLWSSMDSLFAELPHASRAEASTLATGFAGLIRSLLFSGKRSAAFSSDFEETRRLAMRRYLVEHLRDPDLGVASLCAAFGASRATIYRDFADEGGVARFVIRRRLEQAFSDLAKGPPARGEVRRVAERWGFACPYHFSRAFQKEFNLWPSEAWEAAAGSSQRASGHDLAGAAAPQAQTSAPA